MIYKSEVINAQLPCSVPNGDGCYCFGRKMTLTRTGRVYILDIYHRKDRIMRCCADGESFSNYYPKSESFVTAGIYDTVWWSTITHIDNKTNIEAREFFDKAEGAAPRIVDDYISDVKWKKRVKRDMRKQSKQEKCIGMFPDISEDIKKWCDEVLFDNYIFLSNSIKGKRTAVCEACGEGFETAEGKHKEECICPKCGRKSVWWLERYKDSIQVEKKLNVFYKVDDFRLHRWTRVYKEYAGGKKRYTYEDYWYSGKCESNDKASFAYGEVKYSYKGWHIGKKEWFTPNPLTDTYVYPEGVDKVFEQEIEKYIKPGFKYNIFILSKLLEKYSQTEYLLKAGLVELAHDIRWLDHTKMGYDKVLGVEKKYIPLAIKYNITYSELRTIKKISKHEHVSEELFLLCRKKSITESDLDDVKKIFPAGASYGKIIRYADKQKGSFDNVKRIYRDYINMAKELKIELKKKYDIWPKDLTAEHDRLAEKVTLVKNKKNNALFKKAIKKLYKTIPTEFENKDLCIVLPKQVGDFSNEGARLKICVWMQDYINKHTSGKNLICFIRNVDKRDESYVCCEINLNTYKVVQVHGYKNDAEKPLLKGVREFAEKYAKEIKKFREMQKGA